MWLDTLRPEHYRGLYDVTKALEFSGCSDFDQFVSRFENMTGFVVVADDGKLAGCISFDSYVPSLDVMIHIFIGKEYRGQWRTGEIAKQVFDYLFDTLMLPRASCVSFPGLTDAAAKMIDSLGFKLEGIKRKGLLYEGQYYDVRMYGLLKEERRF